MTGASDKSDRASRPERWVPVVGFADRYEVSNFGRLRSLYFTPPKAVMPYPDKDGYPVVGLWRDRARTQVNLHRLVAETFVPGRNVLHKEVAHLDGTRANCRADNLKWVSKVENHSHKRLHGTHQEGDNAGHRKLTSQQVSSIRHAKGIYTAGELAAIHGVSRHAIYDIWQRKRWRSVHESAVPKGSAPTQEPNP